MNEEELEPTGPSPEELANQKKHADNKEVLKAGANVAVAVATGSTEGNKIINSSIGDAVADKAADFVDNNEALSAVSQKLNETGAPEKINKLASTLSGSGSGAGAMPDSSSNATPPQAGDKAGTSSGASASTDDSSKLKVDEDLTATGTVPELNSFLKVIGCVFGALILMSLPFLLYFMFISTAHLFVINFMLNEIEDQAADFGEGFYNFFTGCGWKSDEECSASAKFYDELVAVNKDYKENKDVELNISLITQTLTNSIDFDDFLYSVIEGTDESESDEIYKSAKDNVKKLAENMVTSEEIVLEYDDLDTPEDEYKKDIIWKLDIDKYIEYLRTTFIKEYYYKDYEGDDLTTKIDDTIENILARVDLYNELVMDRSPSISRNLTSNYCANGITVDTDGELEVIDLEEYVARVVEAEIGRWSYAIEAVKAQAIAARSYAIKVTNNCTTPITNGTTHQAMAESASDEIKAIVPETKGLILTSGGQVLLSMYDSFCYDDDDCESGYNESTGLYYSIYTKLPSNKTHTIFLSKDFADSITHGQGHAQGMSQLVAIEMAVAGSSYEEILNYFYDGDVLIEKMSDGLPIEAYMYSITSPYGWRKNPLDENDPNLKMHYGVDLGANSAIPIYSVADGVVTLAQYGSSYGNYLIIGHGSIDDSGRYEYYTLYAHMYEPALVSVGDEVSSGQEVGGVGTTGSSTGNHLHFEYFTYENGSKQTVDPVTMIPGISEFSR